MSRSARPGPAWSLRLRLLGIIGLSLVTLWSVVAVWMLIDVRNELGMVLDDRLAASARMVAGLIGQAPPDGDAQGAKVNSALEVAARDGLVCEVSLLLGEVVLQTMARTPGSPGLTEVPPGYSTRRIAGQLWRSYVLQHGNLRIATADRLEVRDKLLQDIALAAGIPFTVALGGGLLILWFGIGRGLQPVEHLRTALAVRGPDDDSPLPAIRVPPELQPLVDTIEHLVGRMQAAMARERRFTDDAAHELRTPLTAIKTHLQVMRLGSKAQDADIVHKALDDAEQGALRLQQTLNQLLLLARLDNPVETGPSQGSLVAAAAAQAVGDAEAGRRHRGRVVMRTPDEPVFSTVPGPLLVSALRNLIENALSYSPVSSEVILAIQALPGGMVRFTVLDEGPGLSEADRAQAVRRFWRRGSGTQGSGLGLSIVNEIALRYGGELRLLNRDPLGLAAELTLPAGSGAPRVSSNRGGPEAGGRVHTSTA